MKQESVDGGTGLVINTAYVVLYSQHSNTAYVVLYSQHCNTLALWLVSHWHPYLQDEG